MIMMMTLKTMTMLELTHLGEGEEGGPAHREGGLCEVLAGHVTLRAVPHHHQPEEGAAQDPGHPQVDLQQLHLGLGHPLQSGELQQVEDRGVEAQGGHGSGGQQDPHRLTPEGRRSYYFSVFSLFKLSVRHRNL